RIGRRHLLRRVPAMQIGQYAHRGDVIGGPYVSWIKRALENLDEVTCDPLDRGIELSLRLRQRRSHQLGHPSLNVGASRAFPRIGSEHLRRRPQVAAKASFAWSTGNQLGTWVRWAWTHSAYSAAVFFASSGKPPHSKRRRRIISDVSDSADMIIALPSRSRSFSNRWKSASSSGVISSTTEGNDTASTTRSCARDSSERF